ncbi:hypothetical protein B0F90DRAFT_1246377 [Multifurca ochricompacta]|uniref:Uncharacterized protein n=1 Tax=Multifurca ochricompacta TaxID=376703 RepID=A0AAD4M7V5_9AGAM|nr:hypothetical protein B0F90DRAFT_1246377 [Multifurca ochricompacta]
MNITRDDNGKIAHLHTEASGLRPATRSGRSFRDTSGGISRTSPWRQAPTPIQPPGRSKNPYSGRMTSGRGGRVHRVGDSNPSTGPLPTVDSSPSHVLKRAKLTHNKEDKISKYFSGATGSRSLPSSPQAAPSFHPICPTDAIVIDEEGDETGVDNNGSKPTALKASSPDPMDLISSETSYTFDQSKPSPVHQLSSTFERTHRSPKDGESTARLRSQLQQTDGPEIIYRPGSDDNRVQPTNVSPISPRNAPTGKVDASSENSKVRKLAAAFEPPGVRHLNLRPTQSRKNGMKPKQAPLEHRVSFLAPGLKKARGLKEVSSVICL